MLWMILKKYNNKNKVKKMKRSFLQYCYDLDDAWGHKISLLQFLSFKMTIVHIVYSGIHNPLRLWIFHLSSVIVGYSAYLLQDFIAQPRPYPDCVSHIYSSYGLPCPEQVLIVSTCINELMYHYYYTNGMPGKKILKILFVITFVPFIYIYAYVSTVMQTIWSMVFSITFTLLASVLVYLFQRRYENNIEEICDLCNKFLQFNAIINYFKKKKNERGRGIDKNRLE